MDNSQLQQPESKPGNRVPWWMILIIIVCMLPGLAFPWMLDLVVSGNAIVKGLTWFYPAYVICSGLIAYQCYGRRTALAWIILVLLLLSHACFYILAFSTAASSLSGVSTF